MEVTEQAQKLLLDHLIWPFFFYINYSIHIGELDMPRQGQEEQMSGVQMSMLNLYRFGN